MEFRAPSMLGKRPRGYVPDDVAARARGGGGEGSDSEGGEGGAAEPRSGTERVVDAVLRAEAAAKAATKGAAGAAKKAVKSVTFAEPAEVAEAVSGGVALDAAEKAAAARAAARRGAKVGETDMPDDVAAAEERGGVRADADEEATAFEPFNLDAEREQGSFDEHGNYTERKPEKDVDDAWLDGVELAEDKAEKCRREAEAEAAKPEKLSETELSRMKREIAALLQPGETVLRALKRMGGSSGGGSGPAGGRGRGGRGGGSKGVAAEHRAAFERLTELSSLLMAFGEYDVYAFAKESFERAAAAHQAAAAPVDMFGGGGDDPDDDIFADAPPAKRPAPEPAVPTATAPSAPEFGAWSVAQLRRFLEVRGAGDAAANALEKAELVAAAAAAAQATGLAVPPGYTWHAESGLYAVPGTPGLFYDVATGGFADAAGAWYAWDAAANAFVPWTQ